MYVNLELNDRPVNTPTFVVSMVVRVIFMLAGLFSIAIFTPLNVLTVFGAALGVLFLIVSKSIVLTVEEK